MQSQPITRRGTAQVVLGHLDLVDNVAAALQSNTAIGLAAAIKAAFQFVILAIAALFWWYLDLDSTWQWSAPLTDLITPTLPFQVGATAAFVLRVLLTLGPSAIQAEYYKLTQYDAILSKPVYWGSIAFDAMTDVPRVTALCTVFAPNPQGYGLVGYYVAWSVLLALSTVGLQHLTAMALASFIYSLKQIAR